MSHSHYPPQTGFGIIKKLYEDSAIGKLTAERKQLDRDYYALKDGVKEAGQIRRSVYSILRQEQREGQPHRTQDAGHGTITTCPKRQI